MFKKGGIAYTLASKTARCLVPERYVRAMTWFLKSRCLSGLVGVEIGTYLGDNAKAMLKALDIERLYLVDPYEPYVPSYELEEQVTDDDLFLKAKRNLRRYAGKIVFVRKTSEDAADDVPDGLDFVYVDGNHDYEFVKADVERWFPKVKVGGVLGGHDFCAGFSGVARAVLEFADARELRLQGGDRDWWIVKP